MAHFVEWRGAAIEAPVRISGSRRSALVGTSFLFGVYGAAGLTIAASNPAIAQINTRDAVESDDPNNVTWFEAVGLKDGDVRIEARRNDGPAWDFFDLHVNKANGPRWPVRGINYDYDVDTKGIGQSTNASLILTLKLAMIPVHGGQFINNEGRLFLTQKWDRNVWDVWLATFRDIVQSAWSEKFWLATPPSLTELEVAGSDGTRKRVQLHCVLKVVFASESDAHARIMVLNTGPAPDGRSFRANSQHYNTADIGTYMPDQSGWPKPYTVVVHEIGHTLGLHHPCEQSWPAQPYCIEGHPNFNEIMAHGNELRLRYATPWQKAAASWFNSNAPGRSLKPLDFRPSMIRLPPVNV